MSGNTIDRCGECGAPVAGADGLCLNCGAALPASSRANVTEPSKRPWYWTAIYWATALGLGIPVLAAIIRERDAPATSRMSPPQTSVQTPSLSPVESDSALAAKEQFRRERAVAQVEHDCPKRVSKAHRVIKAHPDWPADLIAYVACGWPKLGMTAEQLEATLGLPTRIHSTENAYGIREQWIYEEKPYSLTRYIYLQDGIVVTIQN
jgi:hypothetical protein